MQRRLSIHVPAFAILVSLSLSAAAVADPAAGDTPDGEISYYKQVRPIFQASCHGCHQPAKAGGEYVMTSFDRLLAGGESEEAAVTGGDIAASHLLDLIEPIDGKADMPKGKPPLAEAEIAVIRRWIEQGAKDDTPSGAKQLYSQDNPPVYHRPPVVTSIDYSPDGKLLAVAGFHEVLLFNAETQERIARLVGTSERIESVSFSPDGKRLAVAGGSPARIGEIQVWDVEKHKLLLSVATTFDTVYGGSWSPDGKLIAYGCADTAIRAIDSTTGKEVVYMAAHDDWARDTVFSADGKSIFSVSRDQTVKMTDVATERFVGNVTTHTPGILKGGMIAIARHPKKNELLAGGADGAPKLFRMDVKAAPAGGGNPNQIREYGKMNGRVFGVAFNPAGNHAFAASSLDGMSQLRAYETDNGKQLWNLDLPGSATYALTVSPDGGKLAIAGSDGKVRIVDAAKGELAGEFLSVEIADSGADQTASLAEAAFAQGDMAKAESLPEGKVVAGLTASPAKVEIADPTQYSQLAITADLGGDDTVDVTRMVKWQIEGDIGKVTPRGLFTPSVDGGGKLIAVLGEHRVEIPVTIAGLGKPFTPDFISHVNPVISRAGCNAGTCHGSKDGQNGFKLSLRGYDAIADVRAFTDDLASRRTNVSLPAKSLMLLKATGSVPHQGGQVFTEDSKYYRIVHDWIGSGAKLTLDAPRVESIDVFPKNPTIQKIGGKQQVRVVAKYTDGTSRDVTREAVLTSGNAEVCTIDDAALLTSLRRGEAPVLARYEGAYAATTITVMGDRSGFEWQQPPTWGRIDELTAAKWQRMKIQPSDLCTDAEFIRRVTLDLTGLPPTADDVKAFLADTRDSQTKRNELVDKLVGSEEYIEYWTNKWADLLQVNRKYLGPQGAKAFRDWIRAEVAGNTPYDEFATKILTASGSNKDNPAASYYKILRTPEDTMENTTHLFLGVRFNCNKCHDHPFERWTQDQYYETAAYFAQFQLKNDPASGKNKVGGTAVEGAKPLYEIVEDKKSGEITHDRTKQVTPPQFPYDCEHDAPENASRRQQLAAWITAADNDYFARSYVNRLWGYMFGIGIIEPIDDIRAGNPATNPELLNHLTEEFVKSGFNVRQMHAMIAKSRTYQLSIATNQWNEDDQVNYSHAIARRLPAEVLYDAVHRVTGAQSRIPGVPAGTRAAAIPDAGVKLPDNFLGNLGRPPRESACECERASGLELGPVMALISGPTVSGAISDRGNELTKLVAAEQDDQKLANEIFLRVLNRPATEEEIKTSVELIQEIPMYHEQLTGELAAHESQLDEVTRQKEQRRLAAIEAAKAEIAAYEAEIAEREKKLNQEQQARITAAEAALKQYQDQLPAKLAQWEADKAKGITWTVLDPSDLKATNNAKLAKEKDLSVFASGPNGKGSYQFVAKTDVAGITGVRLELLADKRLPKNGPGRPPNGNFVLTEFRVEHASPGEPAKKQPVALQNAQADFSQQNYNITTAIDGKKAPTNNGWASSPQLGKSRTAVFETKADTAPGLLTFWLDQEYQDGQHSIGKFRISVTNSPRPISLDALPQNIANILAVAADQRNDQQKKQLLDYYRGLDGELKKRQAAVAEAKKPRPTDPKLLQLRTKLAVASEPVPIDPKLAQLRRDVDVSKGQLQNARLTAAQDLTWALINNPAFLFNH